MSNNIKLKRSYDTKLAERFYKDCFEKDRKFTVKELEEACYLLVDGEKAGSFFWRMHYGTYEGCNAIFAKYRRGNYTFEFCKLCCDWMFNETDCLLILGKTPIENKPANALARNMPGAERQFEREGKVWRLWRIGKWVKARPEEAAKAALKKQSRKFGRRDTQGGNPNG